MKKLFGLVILAFSLLSIGCATEVHVSVNSIKQSSIITKAIPVVFPTRSDGIDNEKMRRQCIKGAQAAQISVVDKCESNCFYAIVDGKTGSSTERTHSIYNQYTKQNDTKSYNETDRSLKIVIYSDPDLKQIIYQSVMDSSGSSKNVLSVTKEMCKAGFLAYPHEVTSKAFNIETED